MFEIHEKEPFWRPFLLQQLFVPMSGLFAPGVCGIGVPKVHPYAMSVITALAVAFTGVGLGYCVCRRWRVAQIGRWIWIGPVSLFCLALLSYAWTDPIRAMLALFYTGPDAPELGLGPYMYTYPALVACCYSLSAEYVHRQQQRTTSLQQQ